MCVRACVCVCVCASARPLATQDYHQEESSLRRTTAADYRDAPSLQTAIRLLYCRRNRPRISTAFSVRAPTVLYLQTLWLQLKTGIITENHKRTRNSRPAWHTLSPSPYFNLCLARTAASCPQTLPVSLPPPPPLAYLFCLAGTAMAHAPKTLPSSPSLFKLQIYSLY